MNPVIKQQLAPTGTLRAGINMSNFLLVTGKDSNGNPVGPSPDMAAGIAKELGVELKLVPYNGPGELADAATRNEWDIGNIAAETERARVMDFSPAWCEIQATCLVPAGSDIQSFDDVDQPGIRIAVKARAAYDLWLTENLHHATLVSAPSLDASFELFREQSLPVLAGLRPKLLEQQTLMPGARVLDDSFTAIQQSIGCRKDRPEARAYLADFVYRAIGTGLVDSLIQKHGVEGRLSAAAPA